MTPDFSVTPEIQNWLSKPKKLFINGVWRESNTTFTTYNPATESLLSEIYLADQKDVDDAVAAAELAFEKGEWRNLPLHERATKIKMLGDLILEHRKTLAIIESLDTGKPINESYEGDILRSATNFHFFSDFSLNEENTFHFNNETAEHRAFREPIGVVALITPWNLPLYLETWKIAPALLMGNSVVLKPSELTPLSAIYFTELLEKVGIPKGVFNLIQGYGENSAGEFLTANKGVSAISFTGETSTGRAIMKKAALGPTRVSFELGGKGASIVFNDADFENALNECLRAAFRNQGEICLACPRIFVEEKLYQKFTDSFVSQTKNIKLGNPLSTETNMGALISKDHLEKVMSYIQKVESPAKILTGGRKPKKAEHGYFLEPTVITGLSHDHPISREEVFGPVVSIYPFKSEEEVVALVNQTQYGLSASIYTEDPDTAERMSHKIRAGLLWINCWFIRDLRVPFGGQKRSGIGREGGKFSLDFFSEWKSICKKK